MQTFSVRRVAVPLCLFAGLLGLVFAGFAFLLQTETFQQQPTLFSAAMLIDLLIALPAAFWLAFSQVRAPADLRRTDWAAWLRVCVKHVTRRSTTSGFHLRKLGSFQHWNCSLRLTSWLPFAVLQSPFT